MNVFNKLVLSIFCIVIFCENASGRPRVMVVNPAYRLVINSNKGTIGSFSNILGNGNNGLLIPGQALLPLLKIGFLTGDKNFKVISSLEAKKITVNKTRSGNENVIEIQFKSIGNLEKNAKILIRCPQDKPLTFWNLELENRTGMWISHIQFPVIQVPFDHNTTEEKGDKILYSMSDGMLSGPLTPSINIGVWRSLKYDTSETWRTPNYQREHTTQMMAYYNPSAGLYMVCDNPTSLPKLIGPLKANDGITMGMGHFPALEEKAPYKLPVVLANYSDVKQQPRIELEGNGVKKIVVHIDAKNSQVYELQLPGITDLQMPSRSVGLVEIK